MTQYLFRASEIPSFGCSDERVNDQGWLIVTATLSRDSDSVSQSNHRVIERELTKIDPDQTTWGIMHCGHWAVGWVDHFVVAPNSPAATYVAETLRFLEEEYPILSDDDHSELEGELHDQKICSEGCTFCEGEREDHRRGDCDNYCRLCVKESEDDENDVCVTCGETQLIENMVGDAPERTCKFHSEDPQ